MKLHLCNLKQYVHAFAFLTIILILGILLYDCGNPPMHTPNKLVNCWCVKSSQQHQIRHITGHVDEIWHVLRHVRLDLAPMNRVAIRCHISLGLEILLYWTKQAPPICVTAPEFRVVICTILFLFFTRYSKMSRTVRGVIGMAISYLASTMGSMEWRALLYQGQS